MARISFQSMLRQNERVFLNLHRAFDFFVAIFCWYVVYAIRFHVIPNAQPGQGSVFLKVGFVVGLLTLYFFSKAGLYRSYRLGSRYEEIGKVLKTNTMVAATLVVLLYFLADERLSRFVVLGYYLVSTIVFIGCKVTLRNILRYLRSRGHNLRHIILVGHGVAIERYFTSVHSFKESGIYFRGWADSDGLAEKYGIQSLSLAEVKALVELNPDSVVIGYEGVETSKTDEILQDLYNDVVPIVILPDLKYARVGYQIDYLAGVPAFFVNQPNFSSVGIMSKRMFDVLASGVGLIFISPILLALAIGVRLSSPGPIFFGQERVGLDGRKFKMWKFRSMKVGEHVGNNGVPGWTVKDDPRKTKFGSFIRATSLDELPQLWNVLVGDMSLVGPRPEQPFYVEKFRHEIPAYMLRHKMKAGITGWAQVNGWRGDTSLHMRIECDLYYIRNWSIWLDLKILFLTFWKGFINKNAY